MILNGDMNISVMLDGDMTATQSLDGELGVITVIHSGSLPWYTGATEITPTEEVQVLSTREKSVLSDITINPIPSNYGLVTWSGSGSALRIS